MQRVVPSILGRNHVEPVPAYVHLRVLERTLAEFSAKVWRWLTQLRPSNVELAPPPEDVHAFTDRVYRALQYGYLTASTISRTRGEAWFKPRRLHHLGRRSDVSVLDRPASFVSVYQPGYRRCTRAFLRRLELEAGEIVLSLNTAYELAYNRCRRQALG